MIRILFLIVLVSVVAGGCASPETSAPGVDMGIADLGGSEDGYVMDMADLARGIDSSLDEGLEDGGVVDMLTTPDAGAMTDAATVMDSETLDMAQSLEDSEAPDLGIEERLEVEITEVLETFGVADLSVVFPVDDILTQEAIAGNELGFVDALTLALVSFLHDGDDVESPRALLEFSAGPPCDGGADHERVRCFMNRPGSVMRLVTPEGPPAENRESVEDNWIFFLTLPELSDHLYWVIVSRSGARDTYNYGFN